MSFQNFENFEKYFSSLYFFIRIFFSGFIYISVIPTTYLEHPQARRPHGRGFREFRIFGDFMNFRIRAESSQFSSQFTLCTILEYGDQNSGGGGRVG